MVTLCGGAATTRSPRPRMEMLATQCPRLRRLSGRAAALSFGIPMVGGLRPPSPVFVSSGGTAPLHGGLPPPIPLAPVPPRGGLRPQGGAWGLSYTCVCCDSPPPGASLARRTLHVSRTPHISRTPTSPGLRGCPRSRSAFGAIAFIVGRWGRVSGVLIVSVGRWGRYTTRSALNDARGPVCLNQSCPRGACCWSRGLQRCLRPCRSSGPALPSAWHAKPGCYYVRT